MSTAEYRRKLDELDRLLNDPDVPMQPDRVWSLLADVAGPMQPPVAGALAAEAPER
ncbi:MAG TPA: peptide chain release factor 1 [Rhodopila sp.]|nr:peptide chain release factor 1 [Rhodopila sp.]